MTEAQEKIGKKCQWAYLYVGSIEPIQCFEQATEQQGKWSFCKHHAEEYDKVQGGADG